MGCLPDLSGLPFPHLCTGAGEIQEWWPPEGPVERSSPRLAEGQPQCSPPAWAACNPLESVCGVCGEKPLPGQKGTVAPRQREAATTVWAHPLMLSPALGTRSPTAPRVGGARRERRPSSEPALSPLSSEGRDSSPPRAGDSQDRAHPRGSMNTLLALVGWCAGTCPPCGELEPRQRVSHGVCGERSRSWRAGRPPLGPPRVRR